MSRWWLIGDERYGPFRLEEVATRWRRYRVFRRLRVSRRDAWRASAYSYISRQ